MEEMEDLEELQLVVKVVLQPDRDPIEHAVGGDDRVAGDEVGLGLGIGQVEALAEIGRPYVGKGGESGRGDQRTLMEHVTPGQHPAL
jgi:hypothetical protein